MRRGCPTKLNLSSLTKLNLSSLLRREVCADAARLSQVLPPDLRFEVIVCTQVFELALN
jgi:hypothetical protein